MKIHPVLFLSAAFAFLFVACIRNPEPLCVTYQAQRYASESSPMAIVYLTDTGFVHIETTEATWSKQVRLKPGSVAVLLVDLDRSKSEPDADIARIHPPSVSARIVCKDHTESRTGSLGMPATVGLGISDLLYK